jgi:hypothetical protein
MTAPNFLLVLMAGAAFVAFWCVVRFPDRAPSSFRVALMHVGAALVVGWLTPPLFGVVVSWGQAAAFAAIFGILLPTAIYAFLATGWLLKIVHDMISHYRP